MWPYFFLSGLGGVLAVVFIVFWWPSDYPAESDLVKVSGEIATVVVRDDISNSTAGAMMPGLTSTYFTLKGVDGEFRYPSTHPKYPLVRDYTSVAVDIWVDGAEVGSGRPMVIWQIREHSPYNYLIEETSVSHAEVIERLIRIDRSMVELGYWLLGISIALGLVGAGVRRWNRGRPPPIS